MSEVQKAREQIADCGVVITVVKGNKLAAQDKGGLLTKGKSDPFVELTLIEGDQKKKKKKKEEPKKTKVKKGTINPKWKETFFFNFADPTKAKVKMVVKDWNRVGSSDPLGQCVIESFLDFPVEKEVKHVVKLSGKIGKEEILQKKKGKKKKKKVEVEKLAQGSLELMVMVVGFGKLSKKTGPRLKVDVMKGQNLVAMDRCGTSDPFVRVTFKEVAGMEADDEKTNVVKRNLNPEWNKSLELRPVNPRRQILEFQCWDRDKLAKDDHIGNAHVPVNILAKGKPLEMKLPLIGLLKGDKKLQTVNGYLHVSLEAMNFGCATPTSPIALLEVQVKDAVDLPKKEDPYLMVSVGSVVRKTKWIKKTQTPAWNTKFIFPVFGQKKCHVTLMDKDKFTKDDNLGEADIELDKLKVGKDVEMSVVVKIGKKQKEGGKVNLVMKLHKGFDEVVMEGNRKEEPGKGF